MRLIKLLAVFAALTALAAAVAEADSVGPATPNFNLEAILRPDAGGPDNGFGLVKFRQPKDADKIVYLDVWVRDLAPNHRFALQRATDSTVNDDCTGTNWLTLGQGLVPQAITTDDKGTGRAILVCGIGWIVNDSRGPARPSLVQTRRHASASAVTRQRPPGTQLDAAVVAEALSTVRE